MNRVLEGSILKRLNEPLSGVDVRWDNDRQRVTLTRDGLLLNIYFDDSLVGYKIYRDDNPRYEFLSDTDLYDLKADTKLEESMLKEIEYMLDEYLNGNIEIFSKKPTTWYNKRKTQFFISLNLPGKGTVQYRLPCINIVDFGF